MTMRLRRLLWPTLFAAIAFTALISLGLWQLQRLAWKEGVLASISERIHAAPSDPPPEAAWAGLEAEAENYRHVAVTGVFAHDRESLVFRATGNGKPGFDGPGFLVLTPLLLADGATILVNRGFVPLMRRDPATRAAGQLAGAVKITGLLRPPEPRNPFTPADNPAKGEWYTRDPLAIARALGLVRAAPFTIDADAEPANPGGLPLGGATVLAIPNDHLSYALTWFGLAIGLAGVYLAFCWSRLSARRGRGSQRG